MNTILKNTLRNSMYLLLSVLMVNCSEYEMPEPCVEDFVLADIELDNQTNPMPMLIGTTLRINATAGPDYATKTELMWWSDDQEIATVNQEGLIEAVAVGETNVHVRSKAGFVARKSVKIVVVDHIVNMESVSISSVDGNYSIYETETLQFTAIYAPENTTYVGLVWNTDTPDILEVTSDGKVRGLKAGTGVVRVTSAYEGSNTVTCTAEVTVKEVIPIEDIVIDDDESRYLGFGQTGKLPIRVLPENATITSINWSSSDAKILAMESDGTYKSLAYGTVKVNMTSGSFSKDIEVTVIEGKIDDNFDFGISPWKRYDKGDAAFWENEKLIVPLNDQYKPKYRGEINRGTTELNTANYPIIAIRIKLRGLPDIKGFQYGLSIWGGNKAGQYGGGFNKMERYDLDDGSMVFSADMSDNGLGFKDIGTGLPSGTNAFNNVIFTFKDIIVNANEAAENLFYDVFWVKTFRSKDAFEEYKNNDKEL